jgi:hypothetical protein
VGAHGVRLRNVHERVLPWPAPAVGALLDTLSAGAGDRLWPRDHWPAMRLRGGLAVGARGGHGPVRYQCVAYEPGRTAAFAIEADAGLTRGFHGGHGFAVEPAGTSTILRHVLEAEVALVPMLRWLAVIRPLHDALVEELLDRAEAALAGAEPPPPRWGARVRALRWIMGARRPAAPSPGWRG